MNQQDKQWEETLHSAKSKAFNEKAQAQAQADEKAGKTLVFDAQDLLAQIAQRAAEEKQKKS